MSQAKTLFEPGSIAVVGASANPKKAGFFILNSILMHKYEGNVYPVNPNYSEINGLKCFPSLGHISGSVDLVIFVIPNTVIPSHLHECVNKKVRSILIISSGFRESGPDGARLEDEIGAFCRENNILLLGPNSTGFVNSSRNLFATINYFKNWLDGPIAIAGQTGIFTGAFMDEIMSFECQRLGFNKTLSLGNRAGFDERDFLEYVWKDEDVKVVMLYLESFKNPREFFNLARLVKKEKPIILLKGGRTQQGLTAARSHTGALAEDDLLVDSLIKQHGLIRAYDIEEFFDLAKGFSYQPCPRGPRVGVITMSGANMTMIADEISYSSLVLAPYEEQTINVFKKFLPPWQNILNPADIGLALTEGREVRERCLLAAMNDNNVDAVIFIDLAVENSDFDGIREMYKNVLESSPRKPLFLVLQGGETKKKWLREIEGLNIPVYPTTGRAVKVLEAMYYYQRKKDR
ncbi:MAG: CoA-binding protein [Candidatus Caldarchaeum sp.]